jgi:ribokinase
VPVLLNPAPGAWLDFSYISKVSFFIPNESELELITGLPVTTITEIESAALLLLGKGVKNVIVTLGEKGSLLVTQKSVTLVPAVKVKAKDTTGAGDAFIGSFAYYYVTTGEILKAMEFSNRYAALSTLKTGTQKSFLSSEEFEEETAEQK